jgi:hypothetical protein
LEGDIPVFDSELDAIRREQAAAKQRDENYKDAQLSINRKMMLFTGFLVLCSLLTGGISIYQAHVSKISADAAASAAQTAAQP